MPDLSADAKRELQEAIRIVKEDKLYRMVHEVHTRGNAAPINPTTPPDPTNPTPPPVVPPPDPTQPPPTPPKKDAYWGELLS